MVPRHRRHDGGSDHGRDENSSFENSSFGSDGAGALPHPASGPGRHAAGGAMADDWFDAPHDPAITVAATAAAVCRDVRKVYRTDAGEVVALDEVSKDFPAARVSAIVGPSGSGKSSLLRILACVDRPTEGSVRIAGTEVAGLGPRGRRALRRTDVAYVFQDPIDNLVEYLDVTEQLVLAARLRGSRPEPADITRLLETLGLAHRAGHRPVQLSGGEQQRVAVACAVIGRPAVVVADEPTAELDSASGERVLAAFHDLRDEGVAFILSSHDPAVVAASDHLLRLEHGRTVESW